MQIYSDYNEIPLFSSLLVPFRRGGTEAVPNIHALEKLITDVDPEIYCANLRDIAKLPTHQNHAAAVKELADLEKSGNPENWHRKMVDFSRTVIAKHNSKLQASVLAPPALLAQINSVWGLTAYLDQYKDASEVYIAAYGKVETLIGSLVSNALSKAAYSERCQQSLSAAAACPEAASVAEEIKREIAAMAAAGDDWGNRVLTRLETRWEADTELYRKHKQPAEPPPKPPQQASSQPPQPSKDARKSSPSASL